MPVYDTTTCPVCANIVPTVDGERLEHEVIATAVKWRCPGSEVVC